ncbi:MAG: hypothetical protein E7612_06205 [Ruminococcaceae bacterium]|nr:hypothetical protein [Oscillospiraceae bacterium]
MKNILSYLSLYLSDSTVRFNVGVFFGLFLNSFYIVINVIWGIKYGNAWFVTVAAYYTVVAMLRYFIIDTGRDGRKEKNATELLGALILILSVPMTGMIIYTVLTGESNGYPNSSLPIFAAYAVFSVFRAVYGLLSRERNFSAMQRTLYAIRLSTAFMSVFNLLTSFFSFLGVRGRLPLTLNFLSGGAITASMLTAVRISRKG